MVSDFPISGLEKNINEIYKKSRFDLAHAKGCLPKGSGCVPQLPGFAQGDLYFCSLRKDLLFFVLDISSKSKTSVLASICAFWLERRT